MVGGRLGGGEIDFDVVSSKMGGRGRLGGGGRLDGGEIDFSATSWLSIDQLKLGLTWVILLCKTGDSHNFVISFF